MAAIPFEGAEVTFRNGTLILKSHDLVEAIEAWWVDKRGAEAADPIFARIELRPGHPGPWGSSAATQISHKPGHADLDC
jgi:hypothetical protein